MKQKDVLGDRKQTCKNVLEKLIQVLDLVLRAFGIYRNKDSVPYSLITTLFQYFYKILNYRCILYLFDCCSFQLRIK